MLRCNIIWCCSLFASRVPSNYYNKTLNQDFSLYSSGVLIMDKCEDLLPSYFGFISGLVGLWFILKYIEVLQQRQVKLHCHHRLEKKLLQTSRKCAMKVKSMKSSLAEFIKVRSIWRFESDKDKIKDLLLYYSNTTESCDCSTKEGRYLNTRDGWRPEIHILCYWWIEKQKLRWCLMDLFAR